ncbi:MAG TPA: aldehyde dehydrogenase family protein [Brevibacterium sp.]|nr:aldehyde dehydrogenase family protein [Brevibacterium sp.]
MTQTPAIIAGERVTGTDTYDNVDPADGSVIGPVLRGTADHIDAAVAAARRAQPAWADTKPEHRADVAQAFAALVLEHVDELALLDTEDTGKPISQARTDAQVTARYFTFYGRAIDSYYGLQLPVDPAFHVYTRREPLGVCGSVIAWNYPLQLFGRAVAPAVVTGNAVVLKPADETPRSAVQLAELAVEAGFPPGIINVVPGIGAEAGAALAAHPGIDHMGFVGSNPVGIQIAASAAKNVVPTTLELGGKSPHVVFPDADLDRVAQFATKGVLQNAGQTCSAGSRLLVHSSVEAELLERLRAAFERTSLGAGPSDPDLGPLISRKQQDRVTGMVERASGRVITGGSQPADPSLGKGSYYSPTLIADVEQDAEIFQEEVFGPVLVSRTFEDEDEAVALANGTDYALMAAVWSRDSSRVHRLARRIRAGQVYANAFGAGGGVEYPFGGFGKSGYGREKGHESLDAYTATKTVLVSL